MERPSSCVRLGNEQPAGAAFAASGCSTMAHFLSSPLICNDVVTTVYLKDELRVSKERWLCFSAKGVRDREEAREPGSFARFLQALPTSNIPHLIVENVEFASEEELSALCSAIGSPLCTLQHLELWKVTIRSANNKKLAQSLVKDALFNNTSLHSLELDTSVVGSHLAECLIPALTRTPCSSITRLTIHLYSPHTLDDVSAIFTGLAHNTISLTNFQIYNDSNDLSTNDRQLGTMLLTNTSLVSLELEWFHLPGELVQMLFASLEKNAHLTSLSLRLCKGPDWPSASFVLDSLRVNGMLSHLDLWNTPLKSEAAIKAQLARNAKSVEQVAALKSKGSAQVQPTTVRLFLCGLPYSGKTTLSRSLVRWNTGASSCFNKCFSYCASTPERTRGIELSAIEKDGVKVSLWDMAGQAEYYAFHDQMFPNLSNDATPSLFLFVWNPIQGQESQEYMIKNPQVFGDEFRYWLRFIVSKTLKSCMFKPKIFVAITRADLFKEDARSYIKNTFDKCQEDFQEHIQFDMQGVFQVNARDPCEAKDLALNIFEFAASLLKLKPLVYEACDQARRVLADLVHTKPLSPLVTKQEFSFLCKKHLGLDSTAMQEAVALSLNESGDLIYFKSLELVVIDTHWFCHHIMGNLLYFGSNIKAQHKGFFSQKYLESLLESSTKVHRSQLKAKIGTIFAKATSSPTVKGEALVKLLIGLHLACRKDGAGGQENSDIFIPASLCTISGKKVDPGQYLKCADGKIIGTFMGRRLKCKDSLCTFFTPGIFSLLQVTFHKNLNDSKDPSEVPPVELEVDVIKFAGDGVRVFVEFCRLEGEDCFIDILVSSGHTLDETIQWVNKHVIDEMEKVFAESRGIQGVELAHFVIRPACVTELLKVRRSQAVSVNQLQNVLRKHVQRKGFKIMTDDGIKKVIHTWLSTNNLAEDYVVDLLGEMDTNKVVETYGRGLSEAAREMANIFIEDVSTSSQSPKPQLEFDRRTQSGKERGAIFDVLCNVRKEVGEGRQDIKNIEAAILDMRNAVLPKLHELLTFVEEGEAGKLPRMFVVTKDEGRMRRLVSVMVPSLQNVRLELLCECRGEPHLVDGHDYGLRFATLEDGLLKRGLPFINAFLKVAYASVKVGAHVAVGFGDMIPDFTRVLSCIVDSSVCDGLPTLTEKYWNSSSRVDYRKGQQWLFDVLSSRDCVKGAKIHEIFGLRRIRYANSNMVAWVCDQHYPEGRPWPA